MANQACCPQCGATKGAADLGGLCPSCLLGLALEADEEPVAEDDGWPSGPLYRVLTVLSSEPGRTTYLAEQAQSGGLVALDLVRLPESEAGQALARCQARLHALLRWSHPAVPQVIEGRPTPAGDFCVVSRYVAGTPLARFCSTRSLGGPARANLFARVADAVASGHEQGLCHGRLLPDVVIASGSGSDAAPVVTGYSAIPDRDPVLDEDISGLEALARAMGWNGERVAAWPSLGDLRAAASRGWLDQPQPQKR